jgi:hypothetical protein
METTPKRKRGRPPRTDGGGVRFTSVLPKPVADLILDMAKESDRSPHYWTVRILTEAAEVYGRKRKAKADAVQEQFKRYAQRAATQPEDDPIDVIAPTESADELIQAAAAELEGKRLPPTPPFGDPNYKEKT